MDILPGALDTFQLVLIFFAVIAGVLSATYLYDTSDIFVEVLRRPLRYISLGMFVISVGILLAAVISYFSIFGATLSFVGLPLEAYFFILYIIGSIFISIGVRQFVVKPRSS